MTPPEVYLLWHNGVLVDLFTDFVTPRAMLDKERERIVNAGWESIITNDRFELRSRFEDMGVVENTWIIERREIKPAAKGA